MEGGGEKACGSPIEKAEGESILFTLQEVKREKGEKTKTQENVKANWAKITQMRMDHSARKFNDKRSKKLNFPLNTLNNAGLQASICITDAALPFHLSLSLPPSILSSSPFLTPRQRVALLQGKQI